MTHALPPAFAPFALLGPLDRPAPLVLTCDHAANALPPPLRAQAADLPLLDAHWGYDLGAAALTARLSAALSAPAVLSRASRLVADPNRDPGLEADWILAAAEGHPLSFNQQVDEAERARRLLTLHEPYHAAVDSLLRHLRAAWPQSPPRALLAVHSFTPHYPGAAPRPMHAGVMFDDHAPSAAAAHALAAALSARGVLTALNAPYSGLVGTFYSAQRHGVAHGLVYVQLEVRNDLLPDEEAVAALAVPIAEAVAATL